MHKYENIKIISGGQNGVDRAALDFAIENKMKIGGYCPRGRLAEDGRIHKKYPLKETTSSTYSVRTVLNIIKSDGTLILYKNQFDHGTSLTLKLCKKNEKPMLTLKLSEIFSSHHFHEWLEQENIKVLNIAGPRESSDPGIYADTKKFLVRLFR